MSGLAHYFEDEGIATTLIALVRRHAEATRPPRALWVPFELGRPLGEPNDPSFQREVVRAALALLERADGPTILEDFPRDAPGEAPDPGWVCPVRLEGEDLATELKAVQPAHDRAVEKFGRTTVGVSGIPIDAAAAYLEAYDRPTPRPNPRTDLHDVLMLRFAADDLKAFYLEAAASGPGRPSSRQLQDWFWINTRAAAVLQSLRLNSLASDDATRKDVGSHALVPEPYAR